MDRVLVVEDNLEMQIILRLALMDRYDFKIVSTLAEAKSLLQQTWHALILDLTLPDGHGLDLLPDIEKSSSAEAVCFILTAADDISTKAQAFGSGADDYLTKPFTVEELRLRLESRLKKNKPKNSWAELFRLGDLTIDYGKQKIFQNRIDLTLTPNEFKMLTFFMNHMNQEFSRKQLLENIWTDTQHITDRTIDTHVAHVRKKIKDSQVEILAVVGVGYKAMVKNSATDLALV